MTQTSPNAKQTGSVHIILIVILIVTIFGALGFLFWNNFMNKKTEATNTTSKTTSQTATSSKAARVVNNTPSDPDPTSNWKTTTSPLTGYTIKYPSSWILAQGSGTGEEILTNVNGGKMFNVTLVSAKSDGTPVKLPTIRYMCVSVDDYTGAWTSASQSSGGSILANFQPNNSTTLSLAMTPNSLHPDVSMLSQMYVATTSGNTQIPLSDGGWLQVSASFDCTQGDSDALNSSKEIFNDQPETKTAETMIQSLRFQ